MAHTRLRPLLLALVILAGVVPTFSAAQAAPALVAEEVRHITTVPGSTGGHAVIQGNRMYVGAYGTGMRLFDITNPYNPTVLGEWKPGYQSPADPGLRADAVPDAAVFDGRHIVTQNGTGRAAGTQQTEFLDWTEPKNPKLLWRFNDATNGESHNGDIVDSRRWWLPSGGGNGLRIFDLNPLLQTPPAAPKRLSMNNPVNLWRDSPYRQGRPVGGAFSHIHDLEVYTDREVLLPQSQWVDQDGDGVADKTYAKRDIALLAEGGNYVNGNNSGSLFVIDITDPAKPVALLRYQRGTTQPAPSGSKAVRYVHEAQFLAGQPDIVITSDEDLHNGCDAGGATIHRVSEDLTQITELSQWFIGTGTPAAGICSTHVMSSKDNYVFIGSYAGGLQVVDLTNPAQPRRAGRYIAAGANSWGALVHPDVPGYLTYVGDFGARGLDVFEFMAKPAAQGTVVSDPATTSRSGVNETLCENGQRSAPTVDALQVNIPATARSGESTLRAVGSGMQPYDLNVYFYNESCAFMSGVSLVGADRDIQGLIPEGAHYAFIPNVLGAPTYVYAQILP